MMARNEGFDANPFAAPETDLSAEQEHESAGKFEYASFGARFAAAFLDGIILNVLMFLVGAVVGAVLLPGQSQQNTGLVYIGLQFFSIVAGWLYSALQESSDSRATLGKRALGIQVVDLNGGKVSFGQATGRHFGKILSAMILLIGFLMQPFTEKKQTLHDMMSGCLVIKGRS